MSNLGTSVSAVSYFDGSGTSAPGWVIALILGVVGVALIVKAIRKRK